MRRSRAAGGYRATTLSARCSAVLLAAAALTALTGCVSDARESSTAEAVARVVADTVAAQIDVRPDVDCGADRIGTADGESVLCQITDPETALSYDARVRFINPDGIDAFSVDLTVAAEPTQ